MADPTYLNPECIGFNNSMSLKDTPFATSVLAVQEKRDSHEINDQARLLADLTATGDFPDGGLRAWLVLFGVSLHLDFFSPF
jgi:hypothetical protein